jgi:ribosomal protein S18 acetylase RimI-like enzyme
MKIDLATQADYDYLAQHDHHVRPAVIRQKIARGEIILLRLEERPIGWLRFGYFWDEIPFMNLLHVEEAYRRQGHGTRLVTFWEDEMRRQNYDRVMTSSLSDEQAQHLYRRLGYQDCGALKEPGQALEVIFLKLL